MERLVIGATELEAVKQRISSAFDAIVASDSLSGRELDRWVSARNKLKEAYAILSSLGAEDEKTDG